MNGKIKSFLEIAIIMGVIALAYSAVMYATYYSKSIQPSSFRSFSVSAEGKETAIPDVASFTYSVITQGGKDIAILQKENTDKSNKIIDFLKINGVDSKDIKTANYSIEPRYQYYRCNPEIKVEGKPAPCPPPEIVGYTISQTVSVKIRDFSKIGEIVGGVVKNGANSVTQLSFTIDNPDAIQTKAREKAITSAKEKAESVAKAGGFNLGRLLSIEEGGPVPIPYYNAAIKGGMGVGGAPESVATPTIEPGSQEVSVTVYLRYEIE